MGVSIVLPPFLALVILLAFWSTIVYVFGIKQYFLPAPTDVLTAVIRIRGELLGAVKLTAAAALIGFGLSVTFGSLVALLFAQSGLIRMGCFPYAILLQTVPIVAIAPLVINWQGAGFQSVALISFIVSLFPIIANATAGLTSYDRNLHELFVLHHASRLKVVTKLLIPHAIPNLVTGARTSAGLAVIGAIVGEFFAGNSTQQHGLGFMIPQRINWLKTDEAFAAVFVAAFLGMMMFAAVSLASNTVLSRWCRPGSVD